MFILFIVFQPHLLIQQPTKSQSQALQTNVVQQNVTLQSQQQFYSPGNSQAPPWNPHQPYAITGNQPINNQQQQPTQQPLYNPVNYAQNQQTLVNNTASSLYLNNTQLQSPTQLNQKHLQNIMPLPLVNDEVIVKQEYQLPASNLALTNFMSHESDITLPTQQLNHPHSIQNQLRDTHLQMKQQIIQSTPNTPNQQSIQQSVLVANQNAVPLSPANKKINKYVVVFRDFISYKFKPFFFLLQKRIITKN